MKIKFNSDADLPLKKMPKRYDMALLVRSVFYQILSTNTFHKFFLDERLYQLAKK